MPLVLSHRVRYHEVDAQGFLFNSRYLELADVAMTELFRGLGFTYPELLTAGADPSVVSARLTFRTPARLDDVLEVDTWCSRVGTSSFDLDSEVRRGDDLIAEMALTYVNVDAAAAASRPLPAPIARTLSLSVSVPTRIGSERR